MAQLFANLIKVDNWYPTQLKKNIQRIMHRNSLDSTKLFVEYDQRAMRTRALILNTATNNKYEVPETEMTPLELAIAREHLK